jgi:hypothetical protein
MGTIPPSICSAYISEMPIEEFIESQISDEEFDVSIKDVSKYSDDMPKNKEELYYRRIFDRLFPGRSSIVQRWIPKMDWDGVGYDPSGRAQQVHESLYQK